MTLVDTLQDILKRLSDSITEPLGRVQITPGTPAWDDCCAGQLSLWVTSTQVNGSRPGCPPASITYNLSVQITRCIQTMDNRGNAPSAERITDDGLHIVQDMEELRNAILCNLPHLGVELGSWMQSEPSGGCAAGTWSFSITLGA